MKTIVIKDALPKMLANAVVAEFPNEDWRYWHKYQDTNSLKYASKDHIRLPEAIKVALHSLGSIIEERVEYPCSFVDYDFHGAGMHMIPAGGYLREHQDAAKHPIMPWKRQLSACWYATPGWEEEWGGKIRIGDEILSPDFNTLVIFESDRWHEVLPVTQNRRVLSLFCWSVDHEVKGNTQADFNTN